MLSKRTMVWRLGLLILVGLVVTGCIGGSGGGSSSDPTAITGVDLGINEPAVTMIGTSAEDVKAEVLPETVTVQFNNAGPESVEVVWKAPADFNPNTAGEYIFTGSLVAREIAHEIEVRVRLLDEIVIDENITTARTLTADYTYRVTRRIFVRAPLTVEPGVQIRFEENTDFIVDNNGALIANGEESEPILLTGTEQRRGWWTGIQIITTDSRNSMKYVTIEYAGGSPFYLGVDAANLLVGGGRQADHGRLVLQNSTLRQSAGYGLNVRSDSVLVDATNNTYTQNADGAAILRLDTIHYLDAGSDYTGNDHDHVALSTDGATAGSIIDANDQRTWQALNVPYRVSGWLRVNNSTITIEPSAHFEFADDAGLLFQQDSVIKIGSLTEGEVPEAEHVLFTGVEKRAGYWRGIRVESTRSGNFMNGVTIEYAGSSSDQTTGSRANLVIGGSTTSGHLALQNSILRDSGGYGLSIRHDSNLENSYGNTYTGNAEGPVIASARTIHYLEGGSSYTGNQGNDFIFVDRNVTSGGIAIDTSDSRLWHALDVPYRFSQSMIIQNSTITIAPGAEFEFGDDVNLRFHEGSTLIANGTAEDRILFTGVEKTRGYWAGIQIGTMSNNEMRHVIIEYGGRSALESTLAPANLAVGRFQDPGRLTLTDSILRNSQGLGLLVRPTSTINNDVTTVNDFSNNREGNYELEN